MTGSSPPGPDTAPSAPSGDEAPPATRRVSRVNPRGIVRSQPSPRPVPAPTAQRSPHRPAFLDDAIEARRRGLEPLAGAARPGARVQPPAPAQPPVPAQGQPHVQHLPRGPVPSPHPGGPRVQPVVGPSPWAAAPSAPSGSPAALPGGPWAQPPRRSGALTVASVTAGVGGAIVAAVAIAVPFLSVPSEVSLWDSVSGRGNAIVVLVSAGLVIAGGLVALVSGRRSRAGRLVGGAGLGASGVTLGALIAYLVTLPAHRDIIADGGSYGAGLWLLIGATVLILLSAIGVIVGASRRPVAA